MKAALVTRDRYIKYIEVGSEPQKYLIWARSYPAVFLPQGNTRLSLEDINIEKTEFYFDRIYKNEHEEETAVYYEV